MIKQFPKYIKSYNALGLNQNLLKGLLYYGSEQPTEYISSNLGLMFFTQNNFIQFTKNQKNDKDLLILIYVLEKIKKNSQALQTIIVVPSIKRAVEIEEKLVMLSRYLDVSYYIAHDETSLTEDRDKLAQGGVQILIGTHKRVEYLMKQKYIKTLLAQNIVIDNFQKYIIKKQDFEKVLNLVVMLPLLANLKIFNGIGLADGFINMSAKLVQIEPNVKQFSQQIEQFFQFDFVIKKVKKNQQNN